MNGSDESSERSFEVDEVNEDRKQTRTPEDKLLESEFAAAGSGRSLTAGYDQLALQSSDREQGSSCGP